MTSDRLIAQPLTAREWFLEASRCFLEEHQGCPRCQARHCVFQARWGRRVEFHCNECDFSAAHDDADDSYAAVFGHGLGSYPPVLAAVRAER